MLKTILSQTLTSKYYTIRGKTIEAISVIGSAVGKEKFLPDARDMLNMLQQAPQTGTLPAEYKELLILVRFIHI